MVGTGHPARIYRVRDGQKTLLGEVKADQITALLVDPQGTIWASTAAPALLVRVGATGAVETVATLAEGNLWDLAWFRGALVAAAGNPGRLMRLGAKGLEVAVDVPDTHARCLAVSGDTLFAGTSGKGLVRALVGRRPSRGPRRLDVHRDCLAGRGSRRRRDRCGADRRSDHGQARGRQARRALGHGDRRRRPAADARLGQGRAGDLRDPPRAPHRRRDVAVPLLQAARGRRRVGRLRPGHRDRHGGRAVGADRRDACAARRRRRCPGRRAPLRWRPRPHPGACQAHAPRRRTPRNADLARPRRRTAGRLGRGRGARPAPAGRDLFAALPLRRHRRPRRGVERLDGAGAVHRGQGRARRQRATCSGSSTCRHRPPRRSSGSTSPTARSTSRPRSRS